MAFSDVLRGHRLSAGWTQEMLAERSGISVHTISTLESGRRRPRLSSVADLADALRLDRPERARLIAEAVDRGSAQQAGPAFVPPIPRRFPERRAYSPGVVPEPWRTGAYAAALGPADPPPPRPAPPPYPRGPAVRILLEEAVLHHRIGGRETMAGQLTALLAAVGHPHAALGVIPFGRRRTVRPMEPFTVLDSAEVRLELLGAEVSVTRPEEVAGYAQAFAGLAAMAVYGAGARALIQAALAGLGAAADPLDGS